MAANDLEQMCAEEKADSLTLFSASMAFEDLQGDAEQLAALLMLVSDNELLDDRASRALVAMGNLAEAIAVKAGTLSERYIGASRMQAGDNIAAFPAR